eukprot:TRINITY_DN8819_c0_g1_i1.p1 TRINITY_DN8819_c0_g1~~TRINITY_DN8819_c0_g1_i1.p1  ORF type:complete len:833 (-),score=141.33 TRINITY_DN8819_c0_g1_i1:34-2532(-)
MADPFEITSDARQKYDKMFSDQKDSPNAMSGQAARALFTKSGLDTALLRKIWDLSDIDGNGELSRDEFHIAAHLISVAVKKLAPVPDVLPRSLLPRTGGAAPAIPDPFAPSGFPSSVAKPPAASGGPPPLNTFPLDPPMGAGGAHPPAHTQPTGAPGAKPDLMATAMSNFGMFADNLRASTGAPAQSTLPGGVGGAFPPPTGFPGGPPPLGGTTGGFGSVPAAGGFSGPPAGGFGVPPATAGGLGNAGGWAPPSGPPPLGQSTFPPAGGPPGFPNSAPGGFPSTGGAQPPMFGQAGGLPTGGMGGLGGNMGMPAGGFGGMPPSAMDLKESDLAKDATRQSAAIRSLIAEVSQIEETMYDRRRTYEERKAKMVELRQVEAKMNLQLMQLKSDSEQAQKYLSDAEGEWSRLQTFMEASTTNLTAYQQQIEQVRQQKAQIDEKMLKAREAAEGMDSNLMALQGTLQAQEAELSRQRAAISEIETQLSRLLVTRQGLVQDVQEKTAELTRLRTLHSKLTGESQQVNQEISGLTNELTQAQVGLENEKAILAKLTNGKQQLDGEFTDLQSSLRSRELLYQQKTGGRHPDLGQLQQLYRQAQAALQEFSSRLNVCYAAVTDSSFTPAPIAPAVPAVPSVTATPAEAFPAKSDFPAPSSSWASFGNEAPKKPAFEEPAFSSPAPAFTESAVRQKSPVPEPAATVVAPRSATPTQQLAPEPAASQDLFAAPPSFSSFEAAGGSDSNFKAAFPEPAGPAEGDAKPQEPAAEFAPAGADWATFSDPAATQTAPKSADWEDWGNTGGNAATVPATSGSADWDDWSASAAPAPVQTTGEDWAFQ